MSQQSKPNNTTPLAERLRVIAADVALFRAAAEEYFKTPKMTDTARYVLEEVTEAQRLVMRVANPDHPRNSDPDDSLVDELADVLFMTVTLIGQVDAVLGRDLSFAEFSDPARVAKVTIISDTDLIDAMILEAADAIRFSRRAETSSLRQDLLNLHEVGESAVVIARLAASGILDRDEYPRIAVQRRLRRIARKNLPEDVARQAVAWTKVWESEQIPTLA